jgi:MSHA pilin protein MshD
MSIERSLALSRRQGLTMIELIVFVVIVSIALVAILRVLNVTAQHSADPMINKQLQAIAEAYLEEISSMPFTYCDPEDANVATATSVSGCATLPEVMGPETVNGQVETRGGTPPFNNVNDYAGYASIPASDASGTHNYIGYNVNVAISNDANLGPSGLQVPSAAVLHIAVVVTSGSNRLTLEGYRTRYAPNAVQ